MMKQLLSAWVLSSAVLVGCGGAAENVDAEGCEHLQKGPGVALTATATASGAPAVNNDHKRYDITLPAGTGGNTGTVTFAASEATDYTFFLGADVALKLTGPGSGGQSVTFESSAKSSTACTDIKGRYVAPLQVGTYTLTLGPSTPSSVSLVIEESEHTH